MRSGLVDGHVPFVQQPLTNPFGCRRRGLLAEIAAEQPGGVCRPAEFHRDEGSAPGGGAQPSAPDGLGMIEYRLGARSIAEGEVAVRLVAYEIDDRRVLPSAIDK